MQKETRRNSAAGSAKPNPPRKLTRAEKKEIAHKLEEFKSERDTMEEVFENKEQIEISMYYERLPKPDLIAISEYQNGELVFRKAHSDENNK